MATFTKTLLILFLTLATSAAEDKDAPTFTNRKQAGPDLAIQGEYEGELGDSKWGAHVIATGKSTFKAIGYMGGLPGNGWSGDKSEYVTGKLDGKVATLKADTFYVLVDGKELTIRSIKDKELGRLQRVERESETLNKKPPEGAVVLFDGSSVDLWMDAKRSGAKHQLLAATNCYTKATFGDHHLHIEFRTPFMPESSEQARGNSGVYVQSRYEIQVLDSFGLEGKDNECGGIYQISGPRINMCYPPLAWQTYDVDFTAAKWDGEIKTENARITVRHNGVLIHEDLELPSHTPGRAKESPSANSLFLQNHGNPVGVSKHLGRRQVSK